MMPTPAKAVGASLALGSSSTTPEIRVESKPETKAENPLPVAVEKPSTGKRKFNAQKPPAVRGFKWAANGAGFDCRQYLERDGKTVERFVGYLGKRRLAEMRSQAINRDELRALVKEWLQAKLREKGIG